MTYFDRSKQVKTVYKTKQVQTVVKKQVKTVIMTKQVKTVIFSNIKSHSLTQFNNSISLSIHGALHPTGIGWIGRIRAA